MYLFVLPQQRRQRRHDVCCLRSSEQSNTECSSQYGDFYDKVTIKNATPYDIKVDVNDPPQVKFWYGQTFDSRQPIPPGQTWASPLRGSLLLDGIERVSLISSDGVVLSCMNYESSGMGYAQFYVILIDGKCCVRSVDYDIYVINRLSCYV